MALRQKKRRGGVGVVASKCGFELPQPDFGRFARIDATRYGRVGHGHSSCLLDSRLRPSRMRRKGGGASRRAKAIVPGAGPRIGREPP